MSTETNRPTAPDPATAPTIAPGANGGPAFHIPAEAIPDYDKIVIEDNTPVESYFAETQYRLLTESLYNGWSGPGEGRTFAAFANVGLFAAMNEPPCVPDVMVALDGHFGDLSERQHNSYFIWVVGKPPDVVIEVVSDRRGGEDGHKRAYYASAGVPYYVIFDPDDWLEAGVLRSFERRGKTYKLLPDHWLPDVGLGVTLWEGAYEAFPDRWLRWCERDGRLIPTGAERIAQERELTDQARQRAEQERLRAEQERQRADQEREWRERLEIQLRALGVEPTP